jgi:hypothetical protein
MKTITLVLILTSPLFGTLAEKTGNFPANDGTFWRKMFLVRDVMVDKVVVQSGSPLKNTGDYHFSCLRTPDWACDYASRYVQSCWGTAEARNTLDIYIEGDIPKPVVIAVSLYCEQMCVERYDLAWNGTYWSIAAQPIPEPATGLLIALGIIGSRKRK